MPWPSKDKVKLRVEAPAFTARWWVSNTAHSPLVTWHQLAQLAVGPGKVHRVKWGDQHLKLRPRRGSHKQDLNCQLETSEEEADPIFPAVVLGPDSCRGSAPLWYGSIQGPRRQDNTWLTPRVTSASCPAHWCAHMSSALCEGRDPGKTGEATKIFS